MIFGQQRSVFDLKWLAICVFLGGCVAPHTLVQPRAAAPPTDIVVARRGLAPLGLRLPVLAALGQASPAGGLHAGQEVTRRGIDGSLRTVVEHGG